MKLLVFILAVCVVNSYAIGFTEEEKAKNKQVKEACLTETGADLALVDAAKKDNYAARDNKVDCYFSCFQKKFGIQRADGTLDKEKGIEAALKWVEPVKANEIINKCIDKTGKDACETAGNYMACIFQNSK